MFHVDILFIHGNYPGQFIHLAAGIGREERHRVFFLTELEDAHNKGLFPGVEIVRYSRHREVAAGIHPYLVSAETAVLNGQAVVRAIHELQSRGVNPKLVVTHAGSGLGLYIKDICPNAIHISYTEWYFRPELASYLLGSYAIDSKLKARTRNLVVLQELEDCDVAVTPTQWQRSQFPRSYQAKLNVIFDGVDTSYFRPMSIGRDLLIQGDELDAPLHVLPSDLIISYATRGMEPLRGFPEFLRSLPRLLEEFPSLKVIIAGRDRRAYSYDAPSHNGSWKKYLLAELDQFKGISRIFFTGLLDQRHYRDLLLRSDLHVYFTRPYVVSWGLAQAAACGSRLLVNDIPAIREFLPQGEAGLVNLDDQEGIICAMRKILLSASGLRESEARPSLLPSKLSLEPCLRQWQDLINQSVGRC